MIIRLPYNISSTSIYKSISIRIHYSADIMHKITYF